MKIAVKTYLLHAATSVSVYFDAGIETYVCICSLSIIVDNTVLFTKLHMTGSVMILLLNIKS